MKNARQRLIRAELRWQYRQGAVNEPLVERLMAEMQTLPHRHLFGSDGRCAWCGSGRRHRKGPDEWRFEVNPLFRPSADR